MPVRTWVGRFVIDEGQPQEESALLRSFPRQRPEEEEDELYVLVEPAFPDNKEYCGQLVDAVGRMYLQDTLSITGAVLRAIKAAHQQLRDWNERSLREHRVGAGISCLVVRGRTAYLTQVGPTVAYHVGDGRVTRLMPEAGAVEPLGQDEQTEPVFKRYELSPGDMLLVASPRVDALADEATLRSILLRGGDEALVELFRLARDQQEFALVLLACVVEPEDTDAVAPRADAGAAPPEMPGPEVAAPQEEPEGADALVFDAEAATAEAPFPQPAPGPEAEVAAPPPGFAEPRVRLKGTEADIRYRRTTGLAAALPTVPLAAIIAALVLAAVALLGVCLIPSALQESKNEQFETLLRDASGFLTAALAADDPSERRQALRDAERALNDAELRRPGDPAVATLREQVQAEIATLDAVLELPELGLVTDVSEQISGAVSPRGLALGGGGAYFLDQEQHRVIAIALIGGAPEPFVLFEAGDLVGAEITGEPQHIVWAEELNALLILDDGRRLIAVTPPGQPGRLLSVRDAQSWGSADGIAYIAGNLYVLDRAGDQVWRYPPSEAGFDSERVPLLAPIDLEQVTEMTVGDALYLVSADDTLRRFDGGEPLTFSQAGISTAVVSPASIVSLPALDRVLVVDKGGERIVAFSSEGTFRKQLVSATFSDLRAIAVDEANGLLYMLVGGALYRTPLPSLE